MGAKLGGASGGLNNDINITPLVDVVLVLLIIFMVVTPMLVKGVPLQLPQARNPEVQNESAEDILISVRMDAVYLGEQKKPLVVLESDLREMFERNPNKPLYLRGDKAVEFGEVKKVLRIVQDIGFKQAGLVAEHIDEYGNVVTGNVVGQ